MLRKLNVEITVNGADKVRRNSTNLVVFSDGFEDDTHVSGKLLEGSFQELANSRTQIHFSKE